jgi:hypothetical protein
VPLWDALDTLQPKLLIEGGATGWDEGAYRWAEHHKTRLKTVDAPWGALGRGAGTQRNLYMLDHWRPDCVLAGQGGPGTKACVNAAMARRITVFGIAGEVVP